MNPLRLFPLLLLLSPDVSQAETSMFMKAGSIYCPEQFQGDLIEIIDAKSERQLKNAIGAAIASGSCVGASAVPMVTVNVLKKTTLAGNNFYCFNNIGADGDQIEDRHCSPIGSLVLVAEEKQRRKGDYEIIGEGVGAIKAICKEGGAVMIYKGEQWTRFSMVLPTRKPPHETTISRDQDREIREGCKGSDSDD
jgi:hypothetical protein